MFKRFLASSAFLLLTFALVDTDQAFSFPLNESTLISQTDSQPANTPPSPDQTTEKPRIAVIDFDFSSVGSPNLLSLIPGGAEGVADILVTALVQGGEYRVIERSQIDTILAEQNLGASGRVDATTAAKVGKILGVRAVVIGSVTQFDLQEQRSGGGIFGIGANVQDTDAEVKINARVVDTNTAEILYTFEGEGNQSQSDTQVSVFGIGGGSSTSNEGKLLTLATEQAIKQISDEMASQAEEIAALQLPLPEVPAVVASISGNMIILNKGTNEGYQEGMIVSIERVTQEVKDPETGEVIRQLTSKLAEVRLTDVDAKSSLGQLISGSESPQVGDIAKPMAGN